MNTALAPVADQYEVDAVAHHVSGLIRETFGEWACATRGSRCKIVRLLAASPDSPVVGALCAHLGELAMQGFEFRLVFDNLGTEAQGCELIAALDEARLGLARREGVLRLIGGPSARKVNESLVLGDRLAWIGAPIPNRMEVHAEFGQTIRRPSAVHLAAMGFEAIRVGSLAWDPDREWAKEAKSSRAVIRSLFDWRPGEHL